MVNLASYFENRPYQSEPLCAIENGILQTMEVECEFLELPRPDYPFIRQHFFIRPEFEINHWDHPTAHPLLNAVKDQTPFYFSSPV